MRQEPKCPRVIERHALRGEIDSWILRGDALTRLEIWLKEQDLGVSRLTLTRYKEWLLWHKEVALVENGANDILSVARAEGAAAEQVSEIGALNNAIKQFEDVDWTQISESEKVRYGIQAIGVKQNILSEREDLQDKHRIDVLEQLMAAVISGELQDVLVGLKDDIRREKLKEESIDAEYTVKEDGQ